MKTFIWLVAALVVCIAAIGVWDYFYKSSFYAKHEKILKKTAIGVAIVLIGWWILVGAARGGTWEGEGEISVFPERGSVKNYRLPAEISVTVKGDNLFNNYKEFTVQNAQWPNGGSLDLNDCTTSEKNSQVTCVDQDGEEYVVEVTKHPEDNRESYSSE